MQGQCRWRPVTANVLKSNKPDCSWVSVGSLGKTFGARLEPFAAKTRGSSPIVGIGVRIRSIGDPTSGATRTGTSNARTTRKWRRLVTIVNVGRNGPLGRRPTPSPRPPIDPRAASAGRDFQNGGSMTGSSRVALRLEALNDRVVPSVTVVQDGSTLTVKGDAHANTIEIHDNGTPAGLTVTVDG